MTIEQDITKLAVSTKVELFHLDASNVGAGVYRFVNQSNLVGAQVTWQGQAYTRMPIEASGFELAADGPLARPLLQVANISGLVGALVRDYRQLENAKLTRKRTLLKYLDAVNFPGGVNATADPTAEYPDDVWFVDQVKERDRLMVTFELAGPMDLAGVMLPRRQVLAGVCGWGYRSPECGYAGGAVAKADDTPTAVLAQDRCGLRISSCKLRFGANGELPIGSFPGAGVTRSV